MPTRDFDAALDAASREPVTFTLCGQALQCVPVDDLPWKAAMRLSKDSDDDPEGAIEAFMEAALVQAEWDRWRLVSEQASLPQIVALLEWLVEVYTGRPTSRPAGSSARSLNGGPTSRVGSSSSGHLSEG